MSRSDTIVVLKVAGLYAAVPLIVAYAIAKAVWDGVEDLLERPQ